MPKPFPHEFRADVVRVARSREPGVTLAQIASDFEIHEMTLSKWLRRTELDDGVKPALSSEMMAENRELKGRDRGPIR